MSSGAEAYLGQVLDGKYRLIEHLADGNFSHVFRAVDQDTGDEVAVKLLRLDAASVHPEAPLEFAHEGTLLKRLCSSSRVVDILKSDSAQITATINGTPMPLRATFHVLEHADGALSELLPRRSELEWSDKLSFFRDVVLGAHQMHLKRIAHRDIKSSNVLLFDTDSAGAVAKVSDLGRSRDLAQLPRFDVDAYAAGRGDMRHAPPEHLWHIGGNDESSLRRADIYLAGSVLYELATGAGITSVTISDWLGVSGVAANLNEEARQLAFDAAERVMVASHERALVKIAAETPKEIQHLVMALVRQMCHPRPELREHRTRAELLNPVWGLQWILRRIDIIAKNLNSSKKAYRSQ